MLPNKIIKNILNVHIPGLRAGNNQNQEHGKHREQGEGTADTLGRRLGNAYLHFIRPTLQRIPVLVRVYVVVITILIAFSFLDWKNQPPSSSDSRPSSPVVSTRNQPLPTPPNGQEFFSTNTSERQAPLEIITKGDQVNYLVKLVESETNREVLKFFIRAGMSVKIQMPLGTYTLRYATGKNWFGSTLLFGEDTVRYQADTQFEFVKTAEGYKGFTVELFPQPGGNLHTRRVPESNW